MGNCIRNMLSLIFLTSFSGLVWLTFFCLSLLVSDLTLLIVSSAYFPISFTDIPTVMSTTFCSVMLWNYIGSIRNINIYHSMTHLIYNKYKSCNPSCICMYITDAILKMKTSVDLPIWSFEGILFSFQKASRIFVIDELLIILYNARCTPKNSSNS